MRLTIVALGNRMPAWVDQAVADYARRLPREWNFTIRELKPAPRNRGRTTAQLLAAEAETILQVARGAALVALDERGMAWTTRQLADRLARWRDDGRRGGVRHRQRGRARPGGEVGGDGAGGALRDDASARPRARRAGRAGVPGLQACSPDTRIIVTDTFPGGPA